MHRSITGGKRALGRALALAALSGSLLLAGNARAAGPDAQAPGARFEVRPQDLPAPYATPAVSNPSEEVDRPAQPPFRLPEGFKVNAFAEHLTHARWLTVAPNGDVFLAESSAGKITLLRDADGDGRAELVEPFAVGFIRPHGLAIHGDWLYVADTRGVWRLSWKPGQRRAAGAPEPVTAQGVLGAGRGHWTRSLVFSPGGDRFFVTVGSISNIAADPKPHATVQFFAMDGGDQKTFAAGLRNAVGIAFYPGSDDLYVAVNERDGLGDGLVPDYLTRLKPGGFYGWPYAYIGQHAQPDFPKRPDLVAQAIVPDLLFESHSAPLGLVFYTGKQFPEEMRGDAFVALHGSWNASVPTGYKVVRVPFKDGRPEGYYENFLTGFWIQGKDTAQVWGRPAGLAVAADGSLLVADDVGQTVWRVSYGR